MSFGSVALLVTGCTSSGDGAGATSGGKGLAIPTPFEVDQQIGAGDVELRVSSFQRDGRNLSVLVDVTNEGSAPVTIIPTRAFGAFYGIRRHPAVRVDGPVTPIAAGATSSYTAAFEVPSRYRFPLLWFTTGTPGSRATTVVLRGAPRPPVHADAGGLGG